MPVSFHSLKLGDEYTRHQLAKLWGYADFQALARGVVTPANDNKVILFVTRRKRPGDTQYCDDMVGSVLLWEGPQAHQSEDRIINHTEGGDEIHVFFRDEHEDAFTYVGPMSLYCGQRFTDRPSRFVFQSAAVVAVQVT